MQQGLILKSEEGVSGKIERLEQAFQKCIDKRSELNLKKSTVASEFTKQSRDVHNKH